MQPAEYALMDEAEARMWWYRALHSRLRDALEGVAEGGVPGPATTSAGPSKVSHDAIDTVSTGHGTTGSGKNDGCSTGGGVLIGGAIAADAAQAGASVRETARVLDAGCGTGGLLTILRTLRPDLESFGIEWNPAAARRASRKSGAIVLCGDVNILPFADATFNAAISADVLCHAAVDPTAALRELKRVLRPGGRLVVNLPAYRWMLSAHDRRVLNVRRLTASNTAEMLRQAGFARVRARYWNGLLLPLMVLQRKIFSRGDSASDVAVFPPWLDAILHGISEFERRLPFALPAGGSVLAVAEKP